MDWSRAKTILIVVFILLNLLLGYQLWYDRLGLSAPTPESQEAEQALEQILVQKNIGVKIKLPTVTPRLREQTVNITPADGMPETVKLKEPFDISVLRDNSVLVDTLSRVVPDGESYVLSPVDSKNNVYVLHQVMGPHPMFDVKLELLSSEGKVTAYRQLHAATLTGALHKEQKVLSALTAVSILADKYLQAGTNIVDVQLGYHGQAFNSGTRVLAPYWRVLTEKGERFFVHAITGAVE